MRYRVVTAHEQGSCTWRPCSHLHTELATALICSNKERLAGNGTAIQVRLASLESWKWTRYADSKTQQISK
jgi:hypothetical protein